MTLVPPREVQRFDSAILYVLVERVRWRANPCDFPAWQTVYTDFHNWRRDGTWLKLHFKHPLKSLS